MKRLKIGLMAVFIMAIGVILTMESCRKAETQKVVQNKSPKPLISNSIDLNSLDDPQTIHIWFRHNGCYYPLGICLIGGPPSDPNPTVPWLVVGENGEGYGDIYKLSETQLIIFPNQKIDSAGYISITEVINLESELCAKLNQNSIKILPELYTKNSDIYTDRYQNGYVILNCIMD